MKIICILVFFLSGCVNINVNYYTKYEYTDRFNEEKAELKDEQAEETPEASVTPPSVIIQHVPIPVPPSEPEVEEPEEIKLSFIDIVNQFRSTAAKYEFNYFTPLSIYEIYGVNEFIVEEFVGGNRIIENEIVEAAVLKAREGQADIVYQKVVQRQAFLSAQYPESAIVTQAKIIRNGNWIIYSVLTDNQELIDSINPLIQQM